MNRGTQEWRNVLHLAIVDPMDVIQRNVPLSTQIADQLRDRIASGEFPVGSKLPGELELAQQLGVSRNSVREATRSLVHSGLLLARAGDGTYVRADSELAPALGRRVGRCRDDDVAEVRSILEREAARRAAERATDVQILSIREALEARNASVDAAAYVAGDLRFHRAVSAASGNTLLAELYRGLDDIEDHVARVTPTGERFAGFIEQTRSLNESHKELLEAIEARDPDRAERIARDLVAEAHALGSADEAPAVMASSPAAAG
jgi:DNA-binding FadR family transcriptional regulator